MASIWRSMSAAGIEGEKMRTLGPRSGAEAELALDCAPWHGLIVAAKTSERRKTEQLEREKRRAMLRLSQRVKTLGWNQRNGSADGQLRTMAR